MKNSRLLFLVTLVFLNCEFDPVQILLRPDVETRVQQSLQLNPPAPVPVGDTCTFAVFGDLHIGKPVGSYFADFTRQAESLRIDFFCVAGDITNSGRAEEYDSTGVLFSALGITAYVTPGNHDLYSAGSWQRFQEQFGPATYAVTIGNKLKLIFLDTAEGRLGAAQFNWLTTQLADTGLIKLVITHFPLYDTEIPSPFRLASGTERAKLQSLLVKNRVYAFCSGHIHGWRHRQIQGVNHFIIGTISRSLDFGLPGYLLFQLHGDSISWHFVPLPTGMN